MPAMIHLARPGLQAKEEKKQAARAAAQGGRWLE
jgi:hypothetical protein